MVSHICLLVELGPIFNSMATSLCLKSCEDHSLLKSLNGGLWKTFTGLGPIICVVFLVCFVPCFVMQYCVSHLTPDRRQ